MSMLAERKRKTKWVINPTKKPLWTTDPNGIKFGKGLMEKMGWSAGKGLGANEQGIQEPLKVSYKNDTKGMGFKGNDDDWIEHQDEFNCFLNQLRNCDESYVVRISDAEKNEVKSLEEKSKWSKARLHYQKFTRGKDLSKYSENDLACILGTNKTKSEKSKVEEVIQPEPNINNMETHFGVTTINSGSIQDYFKKKWLFHIESKGDEGDETVQNENSYFSTHDDSYEVKDEKKPKKKKHKLTSEECVKTVITPHADDLEKLKKKKKKKKREREIDSEEETENKRKKHDFDLINDFSEDVFVNLKNKKEKELNGNNDNCELEKLRAKEESVFESINKKEKKELEDQKKKKKDKEKVKNEDSNWVENGVASEVKHEDFEVELILKKKKKSNKGKHFDKGEESKVSCDILAPINQSDAEVIESGSVVKKKKKKDKKEKCVEKEVEGCGRDVSLENFIDANETEISSELATKQKKKKDKKIKIEFVSNTISSKEQENKNSSLVEVSSEIELIKKKKKKDKADINEVKCPPEVEENRKKSKKKNKKESKEVKNLKNCESELNNCLEEVKRSKKRQTFLENEPIRKKMKKSKKDRSSEAKDIEVTENSNETTGALEINEEITTKVESGKKKKDKKGKTEFVDNDAVIITNPSELTGDEKKKKKKKDKTKETSNNHTETQNIEFNLEENSTENSEATIQKDKQKKKNVLDNSCEAKESVDKDIKKTDIVNDKKLDSSTNKSYNNGYNKNITKFPITSLDYSNNSYNSQFFNSGVLHQQNVNILNIFNFLYSYNYFNNVLNAKNWDVGNENPIQSHKIEFLNAKKPDKFYPGEDRREKILRLIHLSDFTEFKGSNLEKLPGYGFLKEKIFNKPA